MTAPDTIKAREADVERARVKLDRDLHALRSPATFATFKQAVTDETIRAKDDVVESLKSKAQSNLENLVEDLKGKATANPGAALAIGAGLAWHFARNPPIATALIGFGLYSLLRTRPSTYSGFAQARENLGHQVAGLASSAADAALSAKDAVAAKANEATASSIEAATSLAATAGEKVDTLRSRTTELLHDARDVVSDTSARASEAAVTAIEDIKTRVSATAELENRDKVLLGVAGVAVSAALGIALQRRLQYESERT